MPDKVSCARGGICQDIPSPHRVVFVSSKQQPTRLRESDGGDACSDLVVAKGSEGNHAASVKEFAGAVIRAGSEPKAIWEEGHGVDIGSMSSERQSAAVGGPQVPNLRCREAEVKRAGERTLTVVSQDPEAKIFGSALEAQTDITSAECPRKIRMGLPLSISQRLQVESPEAVKMFLWSMKQQEER